MIPSTKRTIGLAFIGCMLHACGDPVEPPTVLDSPPTAATQAGPAPTLLRPALFAQTEPATALGLNAFTVNGVIQPRGKPTTYWFEYGKTPEYGSKTDAFQLGPKRTAIYHESWDEGLGGWKGGISGKRLTHLASGGTSRGHVHFEAPDEDDPNHEDGIGFVQLTQYLHGGTCLGEGIANPFLGGGDPDFRDARVSIDVRGTNWRPAGTELVFWAQADRDIIAQNDTNWRRANWAFTGFSLNDALLRGGWQHVDYTLDNDSRFWSYGGTSIAQARPNYVYWSINEVLGHLNCDFFHMLTFANLSTSPQGSIDYDEIHIAYRNHSLLVPSNGGKLVGSPSGSTDAAMLTDGWRNGPTHSWQTAPNPTGPQELTYELARPARIQRLQIHNDLDFPSRDVEVLVSDDGTTWSSIYTGTLPASSPDGPNYVHVFQRNLDVGAKHVKVRVLSGYKSEKWGLGEIEIFGTGAVFETDDDWYHVNTDLVGLEPGATYHYRLVTDVGGVISRGIDREWTLPSTPRASVSSTRVLRTDGNTARIEARVTPFGKQTYVRIEYGLDTRYGGTSPLEYAGVEQSPRTVVVNLRDLLPGATYHYRVIAGNEAGTTASADATFVVK